MQKNDAHVPSSEYNDTTNNDFASVTKAKYTSLLVFVTSKLWQA